MKNLRIIFNQSKGTINPNIYGHFSEHIGGVFYDGLWVGEDSKVENVRGFRKALIDSLAWNATDDFAHRLCGQVSASSRRRSPVPFSRSALAIVRSASSPIVSFGADS